MNEAEWRVPRLTARATELLDLVRQGKLSRQELDLVYSNAAKRMIRTRNSWPADYSRRIGITTSVWFEMRSELRWIEISRADHPNQFSHRISTHASPRATSEDSTLEMGLLDPGSDTTEVIVEFFDYDWASIVSPDRVIWSGRVTVPVKVRDRLDEVVTSFQSEPVDEFLEKVLQIRFYGGKYAEVRLFRDYFPWGTLALKIEVLFEGEPVAVGRTWYENGWVGYDSEAFIELQQIRKDIVLDPTDERFTVRVSGDGEMALRGFDSNRYWSGSFEKPLSDFVVER